jgi:hypothetical protein
MPRATASSEGDKAIAHATATRDADLLVAAMEELRLKRRERPLGDGVAGRGRRAHHPAGREVALAAYLGAQRRASRRPLAVSGGMWLKLVVVIERGLVRLGQLVAVHVDVGGVLDLFLRHRYP